MLHRNWALKLAAVALAVFLWFWVTVNAKNVGPDGEPMVRTSRVFTVSARTVPVVVPHTKGALAPGLAVLSVRIDPMFVTVVGPPLRVKQVGVVQTEALDANGASKSFSRDVPLAVPEGVDIPNVGSVRVDVQVGPAPDRLPLSAGQPVGH